MNEQAKTVVPKLRFPEFVGSGQWLIKKIDECLDYLQPTPYIVADTNYSDSYKTPVLTAGKTFILGYTNEINGIFEDKLPVIIFDDFTTASKFVDFSFKVKSSAIKILLPKNGANIKFMYELLQMIQFEVGAHERHWISTFAPMKILTTKPAEQHKIADCLSSLDDLITAQNQKVEALKQHKTGLMQQLFPAEGETVPKLRLPEFSQLWTKTQLGMLCSSISSGRDQLDPDGKYDLYGSTSIIGKTSNPSFMGERILVARVGANAGLLTKANGVFGVTDNTLVISLNSSINIDYLYYYLGSVNINKLIFGSGQPLITGSILKALDIPVTTETEQKKISDCLSSLDEVIAVQNIKLESLISLKKGLLQQLFPVLERDEV